MILHLVDALNSPGVNAVATDLAGRVEWYYDPVASSLSYIFATSLAQGGTLLLLGMSSTADASTDVVREVDLAGNTLRETNLDAVNAQLAARGQPPITTFHHDAQRLPNGST